MPAPGFASADKIRVEDAILETPVEIKDGVMKIDIEPERFRLLKLWTE